LAFRNQRHATQGRSARGLLRDAFRARSRHGDRGDDAWDRAVSEPIRVLLADDHAVVRRGICSLLEQEPDMVVVAEVASADEVQGRVTLSDPDVARIDVRLSGSDARTGIDVARRRKRLRPRTRLAIISAVDD